MIETVEKKHRILIVDDMDSVRALLRGIFESEPDMEVVGEAVDGQDAIDKALSLRPDLITMDIRMPVKDGFEATKAIIEQNPVPIIVLSAEVDNDSLRTVFKALEAGALAVIEKPKLITELNMQVIGIELMETVRSLIKIKVNKPQKKISGSFSGVFPPISHYEILGIGCSTGGPLALQKVLSELPQNFPIPVVIVQHITKGFIPGLIAWLKEHSQLELKLAENREILRPGVVYFAPDQAHLMVECNEHHKYVAKLDVNSHDMSFFPSIDVLFNSLASSAKSHAIGGLLTGMGKDGAAGLLAMRYNGGSTFVQDKKSCIIYGMPHYAITHGAAEKILSLDEIAQYLISLVALRT